MQLWSWLSFWGDDGGSKWNVVQRGPLDNSQQRTSPLLMKLMKLMRYTVFEVVDQTTTPVLDCLETTDN